MEDKTMRKSKEEIREPRWEGRVKFVEFYPLAEIDGIEVFNDELKKAIENTLPDWDLVRVDCETDGISRYDGLDPAFSDWDSVNGMFYRL